MILRFLGSAAFLFAIVFTIPLAFDVGGRTCGLAFSLSLAIYYFALSTLKIATPDDSRWRRAGVTALAALQPLIIPGLLIWSLNKFSVDGGDGANWVVKTFYNATRPLHAAPSLKEWVFGKEGMLENVMVGGWDKLLRYSTPLFQLTEGFCSLLVIQACGQVTRYLVNHSSDAGDSWMIGLLILSGSIISTSVYFLWRITTFPGIDSQDAILIGIAITCAFFLCAWGIGSGRGNVVESSLLFAYITLCIYQIFTDYQPSSPQSPGPLQPSTPDFPPLPPILMASYTTLLQALGSLPSTLHNALGFMLAAVGTVTPSVIISLIYRLVVLYAAARIIPAVRDSGARALASDPYLEDSGDGVNTLVGLLAHFAPSVLIAVYTSLLMQHFAKPDMR
ncbi:hypothetical protein LTR53_011415 [Teratosphaeriaceae sp. CCFEE 6253]|nr:hypothetical protein LTR53_011415 [Teratosphaeriaceae sp. CCFEE 6253]